MEHLISNFGITRFSFVDDNFLVDRTTVIKFLKALSERRWDIEWYILNGLGIRHLDETLIALMRQTGLSFMPVVIESASPNIIRQYVQKPLNLEKTNEIIKLLIKYDINYHLQFVLGFPDETKATLNDNFNFIKQLETSPVVFSLASPLPGARLTEECKKRNCLDKDFDFTNLNFARSYIQTIDFTPEELTDFVLRKHVFFNLRFLLKSPVRFLRNYSNIIRDPLMVKELLRTFWHRSFQGNLLVRFIKRFFSRRSSQK